MPRNITLTFDDGTQHVYQNAPDDVTPDAVEKRAAAEFKGKKIKALDGGRSAGQAAPAGEIPIGQNPDGSLRYASQQPAPEPKEAPGILDKAWAATQAGLNTAAGAVGAAVGGPIGVVDTVLKGTAGMLPPQDPSQPGTAGDQNIVRNMRKFTPELPQAMQTDLGREYTEDVGTAARSLVPLTGLGGEMAALSAAARPAARAAGGATRAGAAKAGDAVATVAGKVLPTPAPEVAALAQKAQEMGIPLRPDMLTNSRIAKMVGEALEKVPLSGSNAEARQLAFNRAVGRLIGAPNADYLTPDVFSQAVDKSGGTIGTISARTPVPFADIDVKGVGKFDLPEVQSVIARYVDDLKAKAGPDGVIPGTAYRKVNSEVGRQMRSTGNGDLRHALGDLQSVMHDALTKHARPEDLPSLIEARGQYARAMTIQDLVAKSETGDISAAGLMGRVTANGAGKSRMARGEGGEMGDLARVGQRFLKPQPSSGTAERLTAYGLLGATAHLSPAAAAGTYAAANLYNRTGGALTRRMLAKASKAAQARSAGQVEPTLEHGFEPRAQPAARAPLGDLTPDWQTSSGAAPGGRPLEVVPTEGLVRSFDEPAVAPRGMAVVPPGSEPAPLQMPAVDFVREPALQDAMPPGWSTATGAAAPLRRMEVVPTEGLVRSVDEQPPLPQGIPARPGAQMSGMDLVPEPALHGMVPDWHTSPGAAAPRRPLMVMPGHVVEAPDWVLQPKGPASRAMRHMVIPADESVPAK